MARSLGIVELTIARYQMLQAVAAEDWALQNEIEPTYPTGILPSTDQAESLEVLESIWVRETPSE